MSLLVSEKRIMAHSNRHGDWPVDAKVLLKENNNDFSHAKFEIRDTR